MMRVGGAAGAILSIYADVMAVMVGGRSISTAWVMSQGINCVLQ